MEDPNTKDESILKHRGGLVPAFEHLYTVI